MKPVGGKCGSRAGAALIEAKSNYHPQGIERLQAIRSKRSKSNYMQSSKTLASGWSLPITTQHAGTEKLSVNKVKECLCISVIRIGEIQMFYLFIPSFSPHQGPEPAHNSVLPSLQQQPCEVG